MRDVLSRITSFAILTVLAGGTPVRAEVVVSSYEFRVNTIDETNQECPAVDDLPGGGFVVVWDGRERPDQPFQGILAQRFDTNGGKVGTEFVVNTPQQNYQWSQAKGEVAVQANGGFVVVWDNFYGQDGSLHGVFGQRLDGDANKLGTEFQVNTYTTYVQYDSAIATKGDGSFVVTWMDSGYFGASGTNIFAQRYDASGDRAGTEFQVPASTTGNPVIPAVAGLSAGDFLITWSSRQQDGTRGIVAQRFSPLGQRKGPEFQVDSYMTGDQRGPDVNAGPEGTFVVAWQSVGQDGEGTGIFAQRFDAAARRLGAEFQVNEYTSGSQTCPAVAVAPDGSFVVVWTSDGQDGDSQGVFGQRFLNNGIADGTEFQVNSYTTGVQGGRLGDEVDVTIDDLGRIFVVWQSAHPGQDRYVIVGRLFCVDPPTGQATCGDITCARDTNPGDAGNSVSVSDALAILKAAVGLRPCVACRCDANGSGLVTASDAQIILKVSVGQQVTLACPPCN